MAKSKFKITEFTNPSGGKAWRLSGTLNGKRIRENHQSRNEAVSRRQEYEVERLNGVSEGQTIWTTLTHDQNQDAIAAVNILKGATLNKSLTFAVNYLVEHYKEAEKSATVDEVIAAYMEARSMDETRGLITLRQYKAINAEMNTFKQVFVERTIDTIKSDEIKDYLEGKLPHTRKAVSLKTWNNRRGFLSTLFKHCLHCKQVTENPVVYVSQFKIQNSRGTAETLTAQRATEFMHWLEDYRGKQNKNGAWWGVPGCMIPYFSLALFAGIRPDYNTGEMGKLSPTDIRLDTEVIFIEPEVSKVNEKRAIKIQPNLKLWLERYPLTDYPIIPKRRFKHMFREIRKHWNLPQDVMRHTYISMTVGAFRSVGDAALQAGNSEAVIRKHYLDLKSVEEADSFWNITPRGADLPKVEKKDGKYIPTI